MLIKGRSDADSNDFQFPYTPLLIGEIQLYEIDNILRETGSFVNPPMVGICIPHKGDFQGDLPRFNTLRGNEAMPCLTNFAERLS